MKALTLHQPWASLIAVGAKTIETRSWSTKYRGPIAIHAGRREPFTDLLMARALRWTGGEWSVEYGGREDRRWFMAQNVVDGPVKDAVDAFPLPLGAVVATAQLVDVVQMGWGVESRPPFLSVHGRRRHIATEFPFGDFRCGRFAWLLENIEPLAVPVPAKGKQGLWTWAA